MLATIRSLGLTGIEPFAVTAEVSVSQAMPGFDIVGLPDAAVRESRDRVRSALLHSGYPFPDGRIVVNLAPAGVRKVGSLYDLPILIGLLSAQGILPETSAIFLPFSYCLFTASFTAGSTCFASFKSVPSISMQINLT